MANPTLDRRSSRWPSDRVRWLVSALAGLLIGIGAAWLIAPAPTDTPDAHASEPASVVHRLDKSGAPIVPEPADDAEVHPLGEHHEKVKAPLWLCIPFALLLLGIALMPFINAHFWHAYYPDVALFLGFAVLGYALAALGEAGRYAMTHAGLEYYAFMALVGGLYIASGGILIDVRDRGRPLTNTLLLAIGAVIANVVGTTGASMLLIRPFLRMNEGRLRVFHVAMFIMIVSNCGGCLTPIGDPPLYLGFLKGVPFFWTLTHLWPMWLFVNACLLTIFFVVDTRIPAAPPRTDLSESGAPVERAFDPSGRSVLITGWGSMAFVLGIAACVFVDPLLKAYAGFSGFPVGATAQFALAGAAFALAPASIRRANGFTFEPVKEVGFLFAGIFLTMAPALAYLEAHAPQLGLETPTQFYFATGMLSAGLDNAPTYVSFLQTAMGVLHLPLDPEGLRVLIDSNFVVEHASGEPPSHVSGVLLLEAISLGAVFFGALTYIGNGPNFMVKSIVDSWGRRDSSGRAAHEGEALRMPGFFGYMKYSLAILGPILIACWAIFIR